jgi:hypothetical protein
MEDLRPEDFFRSPYEIPERAREVCRMWPDLAMAYHLLGAKRVEEIAADVFNRAFNSKLGKPTVIDSK